MHNILKKLNLFISIIFAILPVFILCMENKKEPQSFEKFKELPLDMRFEIFNQLLVSLAREFILCSNENKLKVFFEKLGELSLVDKEFYGFVHYYVPIKLTDKFSIYWSNVLMTITENNWQNFWSLIIDKLKFTQPEKNLALKWFAINKNLLMVKKLKEHKADSDKAFIMLNKDKFNLIDAIEKDMLPEININKAFLDAARETIDTFKYLLLNGADVNCQDNAGWTPLMVVSSLGYVNKAKLLLSCKDINVNLQSKCGDTALIKASNNGHEEMVKLLLQYSDINLDIQNIFGDTALMMAARSGHENIVRVLLDYDANASIMDKGVGVTAFDMAHFNGHHKIGNMIFFNYFKQLVKFSKKRKRRLSKGLIC